MATHWKCSLSHWATRIVPIRHLMTSLILPVIQNASDKEWIRHTSWVPGTHFLVKRINTLLHLYNWGFPGGSVVKNLAANAEDAGDWEELLVKGMATHSSILAWKIPWTEEPGRLQSMGLQRIGHDWSDLPCMHKVEKNKREADIGGVKVEFFFKLIYLF